MIDVQHDIHDLKQFLEPRFLKRAEVATLKSVRSKTATRVSKSVRGRYNVTARAIAARLKLGMRNDDTEATLSYIGTRIGLINFSAQFRRVNTAKGKRQGATVRVHKANGRKLVKGGFIAQGAGGNVHVFKRTSKARSPIKALKGPSIPQMVKQSEVQKDAQELLQTEYPRILSNRLEFYLSRQFS